MKILQKLTSSTETGNILLAIPRKSIQKKALSMSQWSLGPIHGISTELVEMKIPKSHKNDDIRSQRKPTSKEALSMSMVARAHPWNIDRAHRDEDKQESKKEQRSKSRRRTGLVVEPESERDLVVMSSSSPSSF
ncbi:hypothetical protein Pst134EA_023008 [Puccinia striiformis f. sp. tritici]|uniref:hypothetical protein n=1 Tax=Puccinia striiformis f. sp. tritici TaxID=168172 RepID=UPI002007AC24|nr:hypothetical protein Pst134EA_023008 [Puccinia striiformis f. sp. tritici]KAH9455549.1 hypothetical protein Pst134EA_023008 [Puccinia striiformis f. sp. tritici]